MLTVSVLTALVLHTILMSAKVELYIYDLTQGMARMMSQALIGKQIDGVWHTGVVVFGIEYFYGGGIVAARAGTAVPGMRYDVVPLGSTSKSKGELEAFLRSIAHRFTHETYQLLRHNCNNFSDEVAKFLLGSGIPRYILDLPGEVMNTPIGQMLQQFEGQMRRQTAGNSPLNPFGSSAPDASIRPTQVLPAPAQIGAHGEILRLSVEKVKNPEIATFFANQNWQSLPGPTSTAYAQLLAPNAPVLEAAAILRHLFLCKIPNVHFALFMSWLERTASIDELPAAARSMTATAITNALAALINGWGQKSEKIVDISCHFGLHALSLDHVGSRRAAAKLIQNVIILSVKFSDIFTLCLTTILTRLEEEADPLTCTDLFASVIIAIDLDPKNSKQLVTDVLSDISHLKLQQTVSQSPQVLENFEKLKRSMH